MGRTTEKQTTIIEEFSPKAESPGSAPEVPNGLTVLNGRHPKKMENPILFTELQKNSP